MLIDVTGPHISFKREAALIYRNRISKIYHHSS
jgi:hypothetical protein